MKKIIFLLSVLFLFYIILCFSFKIFPYKIVQTFYQKNFVKVENDSQNKDMPKISTNDEIFKNAKLLDININLDIYLENNYLYLRDKILELTISNQNSAKLNIYNQIKDELNNKISSNFNLESNYKHLNLKLESYKDFEINSILSLAHSKEISKCLTIYIEGHGGDPFVFVEHNLLLKKILTEKKCDFLSMSMLGLGFNNHKYEFPTRYGTFEVKKNVSMNHEFYGLFYDENNKNLDHLALFLSPHYHMIDQLVDEFKYEDINLVGVSGGAWYATLLGSIMPKIDHTISVAGPLPFEYSVTRDNTGDFEYYTSKIYDYVNYFHLYKLMTLDEDGKPLRKAKLIFSKNDPCCFRDPYVSHLKTNIDSLGWKNLDVIILDEAQHTINHNFVFSML